MEQVLLLITTLPEREAAQNLAQGLVSAGLVACVNILGECQSVYRWKGTVETATEVPLLIKTRASLYSAVEEFIVKHHPYEVPEIVAVPVSGGLAAYLQWLAGATQPNADPGSNNP